ncbi:MAG: transglutaminase domain-containing protein [Candidatus Daviesbacteria bacterium]|nr:transglutaminase domain-containing protein [Candidatus Daviesbacteria bacterium]
MIKKITFLFVLLAFVWVPKAFAANEFATSYDIVYDIDENGVTTVTEKITLRNLTSEYYANQFKLTIGATEVSDIKVSDPSGPLSVTSEQKDTSTTIEVKFNQQVAGLGKTLSWNLSFKSSDFAEKSGKIWEVRVPKISSTSNLESYNLTISVPLGFGDLSSVSPLPKNRSISAGKIFLNFDMSQLKSSGVSASFGTNQLFDFNLTYHLQNTNLIPILTNIALPPDTPFQDVIFQRIEPKPLNVTVDPDGNYLGWYKLARGEKIDVKVSGSAKLYSNSKVKNPYLPEDLKNKYTSADKYWEKDNPQIVAKLDEILKAGEPQNTEEKAKLIFHFVVDFLKYDSKRLEGDIERLGAVTALNNPEQAVCMEFTDLFIALTRAANIPARELNGYAYSSNNTLRPSSLTKDILHSWPEYWDDSRGWVMVDPTWENTTGGVDYFNKLDLNHFVFVVKGTSSQEPIPAGSYKYQGQDSNDVKVTLSENDFLGKAQIEEKIEVSDPIFAGFPVTVKLKLTNTGNGFYSSVPVTITADKLIILNPESKMSGLIPAYGAASYDFKFRTKSLFDSYDDIITIQAGGQKYTKQVTVKPFLLFQPIPMMVGIIAVLMALIYFGVLGTHLYRFRFSKRKKS